jgi:hypothetical protein
MMSTSLHHPRKLSKKREASPRAGQLRGWFAGIAAVIPGLAMKEPQT